MGPYFYVFSTINAAPAIANGIEIAILATRTMLNTRAAVRVSTRCPV